MIVFMSVIPKNEDSPSWIIKQLLEQKGYTIDTLCKDLGVTKSNVWNCLYGKKNSRVEKRIGEILGIAPDDIWPLRYQTQETA